MIRHRILMANQVTTPPAPTYPYTLWSGTHTFSGTATLVFSYPTGFALSRTIQFTDNNGETVSATYVSYNSDIRLTFNALPPRTAGVEIECSIRLLSTGGIQVSQIMAYQYDRLRVLIDSYQTSLILTKIEVTA